MNSIKYIYDLHVLQTENLAFVKARSLRWNASLSQIELVLILLHYDLSMQGNVGAASTVNEWKDFRDGKVYPGFPYAVWKLGSQPEIKTQPPT